MMHEWLKNKLGESAANVLYGFWYALIIFAVVILGSTPETTLRYMNL